MWALLQRIWFSLFLSFIRNNLTLYVCPCVCEWICASFSQRGRNSTNMTCNLKLYVQYQHNTATEHVCICENNAVHTRYSARVVSIDDYVHVYMYVVVHKQASVKRNVNEVEMSKRRTSVLQVPLRVMEHICPSGSVSDDKRGARFTEHAI